MQLDSSESFYENFLNFPGMENFDFMEPLLSLDEDEDENEDKKSYFISIENSERNYNSRHIFKTELIKKKRGPKRNKESKKAEHNIWSNDNITRKIQVHFLNFIVSFLNDCLISFRKKELSFKNINYKEKSKVTRKHLEEMKNSSILDIFKNIDISDKYKHYDKDTNKMNLESLKNDSWFGKVLKMKYLDLFLKYYNDMKPLKELALFEKKVTLSDKTKSFYYLLEKNEKIKEQIIYFCKLIYLNDI